MNLKKRIESRVCTGPTVSVYGGNLKKRIESWGEETVTRYTLVEWGGISRRGLKGMVEEIRDLFKQLLENLKKRIERPNSATSSSPNSVIIESQEED